MSRPRFFWEELSGPLKSRHIPSPSATKNATYTIGPLAGGAIASLLSLRATMIAAGIVQIIAFAYLWTKRKEFIENTATPAQGIPKSSVTRSQERKTEEVKQS